MKKEKTIDTQLVDRATRFATEAHEGIVRKGTDIPYIVHPLEAIKMQLVVFSLRR